MSEVNQKSDRFLPKVLFVIDRELYCEAIIFATVYKIYYAHLLNKKLLYMKILLNFLINYNRDTIGDCSHNSREQKNIKKLSVLRLDLSFLYKKCVLSLAQLSIV